MVKKMNDDGKKTGIVDMSGSCEDGGREKWSGKLDFVFSSISFAVGFGNIWRFPYMCYKNGGAVFLIPYFIMLFAVGFPLFYLELCLGQFSGQGPIKVWNVVPIIRGIGYAMVMNSMIKASYYVILVCYTVYYLTRSVMSVAETYLPWSRCTLGAGTWANEGCYSTADVAYCHSINENNTYYNNQCHNSTEHQNYTADYQAHTTPSEDFFNNNVLQLSTDMSAIHSISWQLAVCLFVAWLIVYLCMIKGTRSFGKVSYFTAIFPYIILTILLVKGATLPGSLQGVLFYVVPDFSRLTDIRVWFDAASQVFYSLGCGVGCLITFGSFNEFKTPNKTYAMVIAAVNSFTSIYAGFAIFSILGFMAQDAGLEVKDVATDGSGLVFIAYPQAVSRMPLSPMWAICFFVMLLTLGIGSLFGPVEVVITALKDIFPSLRKRTVLLPAGVIFTLYLIGLVLITDIGPYIFTVMNAFNGYSMVLVGMFELFAISYIYGLNKFIEDVESMLEMKLAIYWKITWGITAPIITFIVVVTKFVMFQPARYGQHTILPDYINTVGWSMLLVANIFIPVFMCVEIYRKTSGWKSLVRPMDGWCDSNSDLISAKEAGKDSNENMNVISNTRC